MRQIFYRLVFKSVFISVYSGFKGVEIERGQKVIENAKKELEDLEKALKNL